MIWLMVVVQWWLSFVRGGQQAESSLRITKLFVFLLSLLGFLQLVVFTIDFLEYSLALLYGTPPPDIA